MNDLLCVECSAKFTAKRPDKKYCSFRCQSRAGRIRRQEQPAILAGRDCLGCGKHFDITPPNTNQRYCSAECSRLGAQKSRAEFHQRNSEYSKKMWQRHKHKDPRSRKGKGVVEWLRRKFPDLPPGCESCGETRVLDVAHKPEYARNGAWRTRATTQRYMFWVLCPTCHALLDRNVCTAQELGLRATLV